MHIDTATSHQRGKTYIRHLLRHSYREAGKVKKRTVANLSHCSDEEIAAMKLALKHKGDLSVLGTLDDITTAEGHRIGAVFCLHAIAHRLGIAEILGHHRDGRLALWQVLARLIDQGSRLSAVRLATSHAACEILGLESFHEDHLYANLAWLAEHQPAIEQRLFRRRYGTAPPQLFLYDVTSSYLEGVENILAAFGYNRDGKKGKKQLVIGLLTAPDGGPVAVRVFAGNTPDTQTVAEQVRVLAQQFGVKEVTLVGDRGMLKQPQIELLQDAHFHFITAITKPQIRSLVKQGVFQLDLFDEQICEVEHNGVRYVLRRNPVRAEEMAQSRADRLASLRTYADQQSRYLAEHLRARVDVAQRKVNQRCRRYQLAGFVTVEVSDRTLGLTLDEEARASAVELDGCYVIKTDVCDAVASAQQIHDRYKDLAHVEHAFRTCKTGHLETRPVFVRTEPSTRGHVFVVMLAYLIERELAGYWRALELTVAEGIDELGSLRGTVLSIGSTKCQKVPRPTGRNQQLLDAAQVELPEVLPLRQMEVATRKKLVERRK
jgi:transposase